MTRPLGLALALFVLTGPAFAQTGAPLRQPLPRDEERDRNRQLLDAQQGARAASPYVKLPDLNRPRVSSPAHVSPPKPLPVKPNGSWRGWLAGVGAAIAGAFGAIFRSRQK